MSVRSRTESVRRRLAALWIALWIALGVLTLSPPARAFFVTDPVHKGCHERLTADLIQTLGYRGGAVPAPTTHDEDVFIARQGFDASPYPHNMLAMALILGVRSNDTAGYGSDTLINLALESNEEDMQPPNCLRRLSDDGEIGSELAVRRCREFIRREAEAALEGLSADGGVDPFEVEDEPVFIPYQGTVQWPLSRFYYHAGRALHALQDSFSHTYRDPSWHRVLTVLNWVDPVHGGYQEERDGPQHALLLDDCDAARPWREGQLAAATAASHALYGALLSAPASSRDAALASINAVLDDWLTFQPGCGVETGYCGSAVSQDIVATGAAGVSALRCDVGSPGHRAAASPWPVLLALLVLLALGARAGRRRG